MLRNEIFCVKIMNYELQIMNYELCIMNYFYYLCTLY